MAAERNDTRDLRGHRDYILFAIGGLMALIGLALIAAGGWLIALGGSWYYALVGIGLAVCGYLLTKRNPAALWVYALVTAGTLLWAIWESGLNWWPLAARGDALFVGGLILITPWIVARLRFRSIGGEPRTAPWRYGRAVLTLVLGAALAVGAYTWFVDPHRLEGALPQAREANAAAAESAPASMAAGDWHAYGRTAAGQRYAPLTQITPDNVRQLQVAWTYHTGDVRGRSGDPVETTFEVTPLKIGNSLVLCTPHQNVIALDASTGKEIWRYDPRIRNNLALQHLTCRGLAYYAGNAATTADGGTPAAQPSASEPTPTPAGATPPGATPSAPGISSGAAPDLPVAARDAPVATCNAKLIMPTADGRLIALSPDTGAVCSNFGDGTGQINLWANMPNVRPGAYYSTSPPVVTADLIIVGGTVLDNVSTQEQSGVIRAYDVRSGALVWNWDSGNPTATEPLPAGQTYTPNSPNSWTIMSADETLGLVYVPLGNQPPDQWGGHRSAEVERFSSSVVALEIATGRMRWVFQTVHHDLWDYDVPSQPSLIDLTINGERIPALVQPTKQGELFVLDRRDGKPVVPVREVAAPQGAAPGDHTAATQPVSALSFDPPKLRERDMWGVTMFDQLACRIQFRKLRYEGRFTPPSLNGSLIYPGNFGVFNWGSIAVDPQRQVAFTTPTYLAFVSRLIPRKDDQTLYVQGNQTPSGSLPALNENFGAPYAVKLYPFTSPLNIPCQAPPWGYVAGVDLTAGKIVWRHKNGTVRDLAPVPLPFEMGVPNLGGPVMTAGGVAFLSGTLDYYLRAYDVTTGTELWRSRLPAGGQATPMTYTNASGRQFVLVVAGGHGSLGTKTGDAVIAYALPQ